MLNAVHNPGKVDVLHTMYTVYPCHCAIKSLPPAFALRLVSLA